MALSDSRGSLWTQFTTHPPSSGSTVEYTSVDSRYRDGCDKKKKKRQPRVRLSFNVKRHIFATTCLSSWCDLICLRRRRLLLPWRNRRQRCKSHPCVPNWAPSPADVGFNNILLYNLLRKWPAGLQVSLETYFRGMCFIATVNFMRAVKLSGGVCCQRSCCLNQRFNNAPPPQKKKKGRKGRWSLVPLRPSERHSCHILNDKSSGGIEMQRSLPVSMSRTKLPSLTPFKGAMREIYSSP